MNTAASTKPDDDYLVPKRRAHYVLFLLFMLMLFDFLDRQVVSALLPAIKAEWSLSDTQLGMIVSIVNVAIAVLVLPSAVLIDRWSRTKMIGGMAVLWTLATVACGMATNFYQMLVARFFIGIGEAGYGPGGGAMVAALYPRRKRGTVMAIFHSAGAFGAVLGVVLGGFIAAKWGWRMAFGVVAVPGLLFAILIFFARDYRSVALTIKDARSGEQRAVGGAEGLLVVLRTPVLLVLFAGAVAQYFFLSVFANWLPSFFARVHGMPLGKAGTFTGLAMLGIAFGNMAGGLLFDKLSSGVSHRRLLLSAIAPLLSAPVFIAAFGQPASAAQIALIMVGAFLVHGANAPMFAAIADLIHPGVRSTAVGLMVFCQNVFGMALGPTVGGMLSDRFDLPTALLIVSFVPIIGASCFAFVGRNFERATIGDSAVKLSLA